MRLCRKCGVEKPLTSFRESKPGYRRHTCSECMDRAYQDWKERNSERSREWWNEYYAKNREKRIAQAAAWNEAEKPRKAANQSKHYAVLKEAAYAAYGGYVCVCCGETEPMFLSIDHVNNNQREYAKKIGHFHTGYRLVKWLKDHDYPQGEFQILCHNCNQGKRLNGGVCPHETKKAQRLSGNGVGSSEPKRPTLCEEVMI